MTPIRKSQTPIASWPVLTAGTRRIPGSDAAEPCIDEAVPGSGVIKPDSDMVKPGSDAAKPCVADAAQPAVADTAEPAVADAAEPAVPDTAEPGVPEAAEPAVADADGGLSELEAGTTKLGVVISSSATPSGDSTLEANLSTAPEDMTGDETDSEYTIFTGKRRRSSPLQKKNPKRVDSKSSPEATKPLPPSKDTTIKAPSPTMANDNPTSIPKMPTTTQRQGNTARSPATEQLPPRQLNMTPSGTKEKEPKSDTPTGKETSKAGTSQNQRRPKHFIEPSLQIAVTSTDDGSVTAAGYAKGKRELFRKDLCKALKINDSQLKRITEIKEQKKVLATIVGDFKKLEEYLENSPIHIVVQPNMTLHVALKHYAYIIKGVNTSADLKVVQSSVADFNNINMMKIRFMGKTAHKDKAPVYFETEYKLDEACMLTYTTGARKGNWRDWRVQASIHSYDKSRFDKDASKITSTKKTDQTHNNGGTSDSPIVPFNIAHKQQTKKSPQSKQTAPKKHQHEALPPLPEDPFVLFLLERIDQTHWDNVNLFRQVNHLRHTLRQAENLTPWSRPYPHMNRH